MSENFVHLRVQSSYSLLASTIKLPSLIACTKKNKMSAVALTDRANLFGSLEFALEAKKYGIQPIHGLLINLKYDGPQSNELGEILLLAKDQEGYKNLLYLGSAPYLKNDRKYGEYITLEDLEEHNNGLIMLSGYSDGPIGKELLKNNQNKAQEITERFISLFGDRFYFEIFRHSENAETKIESKYLLLASKLNVPLVATNKVLFENMAMQEAHDVLLCIEAGVTKDNQARKHASNQCYFKSSKEMSYLFRDIFSSIENAANIAKRCYVMAEEQEPMLPNFASDTSEEELLRTLSTDGLNRRLEHKFKIENIKGNIEEIRKNYFARLEYELEVVLKMKFAGYFLIVSDFIKWSKQNGIYVGPGRGSGAGSIIAWSMLITDLDPIKFGLLFERFLNPERVSMPDFDIDFCQERREEVINYVRSKYGDNRVAQIITFGKLQAKAVIKDVARVLSLRYEIADYLTELVPFNAVNPVTLNQAVREVAELKQAYGGKGLYNFQEDNELIKQVLDTALVLEGLHRHCSVHAAGIVIAGRDLLDIVPLYKDQSADMSIIQYSMKYAELAGLVKFDFLGLQTLTVISKTVDLLKKTGVEIDLSKIDFFDQKTYAMLSAGAGVGVFQFESVGMKDTLKKLRPDCIEDLMALGALYRPGPMDNIPTYIACKHKKQEPDYLHPKLKNILQETHGVIVYQEQVLEIAKVLAGYSLGAADLLRRAMGKKIKSEMEAQEKLFTDGAEKNGISKSDAKDIFSSVAKFAGYGFNRAHAASYAVISYYTAYLKANYPVEFLVACLNLDISDQDQINVFKEEARKLGIRILAPDICRSNGLFSIAEENREKVIIYALGAIRSVTVAMGNEIATNRASKGNFKNISDFIRRLSGKSLTKRSLEGLIKAGALDSLEINRKKLLESVSNFLSYSTRYLQDKSTQQFNIFGSDQSCSDILVDVSDLDDIAKANFEFEVLGLFIKYHPIFHYLDSFKEFEIEKISEIADIIPFGSSQVKIAGFITKKDARMSGRGRFITVLLSDPTGSVDVTIFSENVLKDYASLIAPKNNVIVFCDTFKDAGSIRLTATKFIGCDEYFKSKSYRLEVIIKSYEKLNKFLEIMQSNELYDDAKLNIELILQIDQYNVKINFTSRHKLSSSLKKQLSDL